jgi:hypothetical protein
MKFIFFVCLIFHTSIYAQNHVIDTFKEKVALANGENTPKDVINIAKSFLGRPYKAGTLEVKPEQLVCNLSEFDCYTFVETVTAMALVKTMKDPSFENYLRVLQKLRYHDGEMNGYGSRIHYFFDWAKQMEKYDLLEDLTPELGRKIPKEINFMSSHPSYYPILQSDNIQLNAIKKTEKELNTKGFFEIPKDNFAAISNKIEDGDIIAFTSTVNGLDVNHEGFAIRKNGKVHLLHASLEQKKIVISDETVEQYLNRIKKHSGVMLLRLF